jgi:hypothetical protein
MPWKEREMLKAVDDSALDKQRDEFAKSLEALAQQIRRSQTVPTGIFAQIFMSDGQIVQFRNMRPGFDFLKLFGIFEMIKLATYDEFSRKK